jgi:nitroreductase
MFTTMIKKSIHKSQHCQRNWDLHRKISEDDLAVLETAVTACPSKQNIIFYRPYFIQDRNLIEQIHDATNGFTINYQAGETKTNSQTLANMLVALVEDREWLKHIPRNTGSLESHDQGYESEIMKTDKLISVGVAAGYLNLSATMLGLSTGCCTCFDNDRVQEILGVESSVLLLMGIGYSDDLRNRREHHTEKDFMFPTFSKKVDVVRL